MHTPASTEKPLCLYPSISFASKFSSSPRPTKARRIRFCSVVCTCATGVASMPVAGWNTTPDAETCIAASALPSPATSSNTPSTTQTWKWTCSFRLEPNLWMKATAPMCRLSLSALAAPMQCACRLCAITRFEDAQHHIEHWPVALHEVTKPFGDRQHPLAHRQAGEDVVAQVCRRFHHPPRGARGADAGQNARSGCHSNIRSHKMRQRRFIKTNAGLLWKII